LIKSLLLIDASQTLCGVELVGFGRHDKIVFMQTLDLVGVKNDFTVAPAKGDIRVMHFLFGKLANFVDKIKRGLKIIETVIAADLRRFLI
jgi:hypothetical protein